MRRRTWWEAEQARSDAQEADIVAAHKRVATRKKVSQDTKGFQRGEEDVGRLNPISPQPWIRAIPYTTTGQVVVPKKPYHQEAVLVGAGGVAFDISFHPAFPLGQTGALPGDRNHVVMVYAGQQLWMRSAVIIGSLTIIIVPELDAEGNTICHTNGANDAVRP